GRSTRPRPRRRQERQERGSSSGSWQPPQSDVGSLLPPLSPLGRGGKEAVSARDGPATPPALARQTAPADPAAPPTATSSSPAQSGSAAARTRSFPPCPPLPLRAWLAPGGDNSTARSPWSAGRRGAAASCRCPAASSPAPATAP